MVRKKYTIEKAQLKLLTMKSNSKFDGKKMVRIVQYRQDEPIGKDNKNGWQQILFRFSGLSKRSLPCLEFPKIFRSSKSASS